MRKILLFIGCLLFSVNSVNAMTINEDGTRTNNQGVNITKEQYEVISKEFSDNWIDQFNENKIMLFSNTNRKIKSEKIYSVTTYELDRLGNIIDETTIYTTKEQAEAVAKNDNLYVTKNGTLQESPSVITRGINYDYYSTESKEVEIQYFYQDGEYTIKLYANWFKLPKIRQFDVMAVRWERDANVTWAYGTQESDAKYNEYNLTGNNTKYNKRGLGISMNLHDNAKKYLSLQIMFSSKDSFGTNIYGTYQHARHSNANTLKISQSYSFASNGLGGVLYFSNSTYRGYYDGMEGVKWKDNI